MRLLWADLLKIIAIFGVILLHVSAPFLIPFEMTRQWWVGNIYDSLTRWCVPLFVMISGTLILPGAAKRPLRQFLFTRVRRIFVPFLVWSIIYFAYRIHGKGDSLAWTGFFTMILTEPVYYHLWFIYMLIVLYLFAPAAGAFLKEAPEKHTWYLLGLWFFWTSLLPVIDKSLLIEPYFTPNMDDYSPLRLSGYFLLGYVLKDRYARSGTQIFLVLLIFAAGGAATIFGTYAMSRYRGEFHPFFYKYFSVTVVTMTGSLFLLVKSVFRTRRETTEDGEERIVMNSPKILQKIGMSVFGVYLIHALVLELLRDGYFGVTIDHTSAFGMTLPPVAGIPVFALSIFVLSLVPVLIIRSIPIAKDILT